ncbi:hypothetical protein SNEBB_004706 [Seison nebaliae]|nr:hypothetical protein SNEBB_004706 [Seison nebaliae]
MGKWLDLYVEPLFKDYDLGEVYIELKKITGIDNAYDLHNPTVKSVCNLILEYANFPAIELIVKVLFMIIDYFNDPKSEINEDNIRKLFNDVGRPGIIYGTATREKQFVGETQCGVVIADSYLKVTGYLRSCSKEKILSHLSKYGIKVEKISRIDKGEDQIPIESKIGVFILRLKEAEFKKAFDKNIWHKGTSVQHYLPKEVQLVHDQWATEYY